MGEMVKEGTDTVEEMATDQLRMDIRARRAQRHNSKIASR